MLPTEIYEKLNEHVIGQEEAKKSLSIAAYNHFKRLSRHTTVNIKKSNVLLLGNTGTGKTLLVKTLADILEVPFVTVDVTKLTESGFVGQDIENILRMLLVNAGGNVNSAQRGIVFLDEIDKLRKSSGENSSLTREVGSEGVQQGLLTIIEGTVAEVPPQGGRRNPIMEAIEIDTTNILFIAGGAFVGLDEMVSNAKNVKKVGFGEKQEVVKKSVKKYENVSSKDLIKYGMIPEFIGRFPIISRLQDLTDEDMVRILTEPKDSIIDQYVEMVRMDRTELTFSKGALLEIVKQTIDEGAGARGLRRTIEKLMSDVLFYGPANDKLTKLKITKTMVRDGININTIKCAV